MLAAGDRAPTFTLPGTEGEEIRTYDLDDGLGGGPVLIVFFPWAFSPVCTEEVCRLRDVEWFSLVDGLSIMAISTDSPFALREFARRYDLDFPLLSDADGAIASDFGILQETFEGFRQVPERATFLVDPDGRIAHASATNPLENADLAPVRDALAKFEA